MHALRAGLALCVLLAGCLELEPLPPPTLEQRFGIAPFAPDPGGPSARDDWFVVHVDDAAHGFSLDVPDWAVVEHESGWRYTSIEYKVLVDAMQEPMEEFMLLIFSEDEDGLELRTGDVMDTVSYNWTLRADGETTQQGATLPASEDARWVRLGTPPGQSPPQRLWVVVSANTTYATGVAFAFSPRILSAFDPPMWGDGWYADGRQHLRHAVEGTLDVVGRLVEPIGSSPPWRHETMQWQKTDPAIIQSINRQWTEGFAASPTLGFEDLEGSYTQHEVQVRMAAGGFGFVQAALGAAASGQWRVDVEAGARTWHHEDDFAFPARATPDALAPLGLDGIHVDSMPQMALQGEGAGPMSLHAAWSLQEPPESAIVVAQAIQAPVPLAQVLGMSAAELTCTVTGAARSLDPLAAPAVPDPSAWRHPSGCYRFIPQFP